MDGAVIEIEGLSKSYGSFAAVRDLSLSITRGEVFGFLGPNGAGKTTAIRMLMGILVPSSGTARIEGLDCQRQSAAVKRVVGYLPDAPAFYDFLRGREILQFVAEMHGQIRPVADAAEEYASNYSTGMKKKLGLACALVHDPPVLILDEPTNGLDPRAQRDVQDRLRAASAAGKTVFLSTHLLDMAEKLCSRVGIIDQGALVSVGPVSELRATLASGASLEEVFLKVTHGEGEAPTT
jgi:ABC-2 type transport system ATP-binding protein